MSNFSELQCFNKLLLDKMQRMQKKIEKLETENLLLTNYAKEYNSLMDCIYADEYYKCYICDLWDRENDVNWVEMEGGSERICNRCYEENKYYCCDNCGEHYCEDEMKKMKEGYDDDVCNRCYKGYIIHEIDNGIDGLNDSDVINEIVYERDKVMEELLEKVKTN